MSRPVFFGCWTVILSLTFVATATIGADDRTAGEIVKAIDAIEIPKLDESLRNDEKAVREFDEKRHEAWRRRGELIDRLYEKDADNPRLAKLLPERWTTIQILRLMPSKELTKLVDRTIEKAHDPALKVEAIHWRTRRILANERDFAERVRAVERFVAIAPKDERAAQLVKSISFRLEVAKKSDEAKALVQRVLKQYPDTDAGAAAEAILRRLDTVGKPFAVEFADAVTGSPVSIKSLKGKVVVIDFWATWCGPCIRDMPKMKELYAEYKDKGVEFIGVSLDRNDGGLEKLTEFVKKEAIPWPQYYQGDGWESEFSSSWGIIAIPWVFVVEQDGRLYSTEARGKLESIITELLKKAGTKAESIGKQ